jgi:preprotein translocase subunit SecF
MFIIRYKKIFIGASAILMLASIVVTAMFGLNLGIDFTGGTIIEVRYQGERPTLEVFESALATLGIEDPSIRPTDEDGYIVRTIELSDTQRQDISSYFAGVGSTIERFNAVGPVIGKELRNKSYVAIIVVSLAIVLFVAFAFRAVSRPVSSWKYGIIAIIALIHDIIIPTGVLAILGQTSGLEVDVLFVMALLAILGYSVNDTIVVFDRVRENLQLNNDAHRKEPFEIVVGKSLQQTYARSINTSLTTLTVLLTLFVIGGVAIHTFVLTLIIGVVAGTYSSIFLASPMLTLFSSDLA